MGDKISKATEILKSCLSPGNGVFASPDRYKYQCWTRDLALAVAALLWKDNPEIVRMHLENLSKRQRKNGQIPILFVSDEVAWRKKKVAERGDNSFMVKRYDAGELWNLTPGTKDSEILYIIAMYEYAQNTGDKSLLNKYTTCVTKAIEYVEKNNLNEAGLAIGADWRDTMEIFLSNKALLTNNVLLAYAYELMGEKSKAEIHKQKIMEHFWKDGNFVDYIPGGNRPDPLGISLAVLFGIIPESLFPQVKEILKTIDTEYGVTIKCIHNPYKKGEKEVFERTEGVVVWPFVVGFSVMALQKMGFKTEAKAMFEKLEALDRFYEWYDPDTGKGWGSDDQLWSATLYFRAKESIKT